MNITYRPIVSCRGEQYAGWKALPPGSGVITVPPAMTVEAAAQRLVSLAGWGDPEWLVDVIDDAQAREHVYRLAARNAHPDTGGTTAAFQQLQEAKRVLDGAR